MLPTGLVAGIEGMVRRWRRRERQRLADGLLRAALLEIRFLSLNRDGAGDPEGRMAQITMIADACHSLPGAAALPRRPDGFDPFVYLWQTASPDQREWLRRQLDWLDADSRWLVHAPPWPGPAVPPAEGPRLRRRGWRFPRKPGAYATLDTETLRKLALEAAALEPPGRKSPGWLLAHLEPQARHVVRASQPREPLLLPHGPADLRQYRSLLRMQDGATVVGHLRLRESAFSALPRNLSFVQRLKLAAAPPTYNARDAYLWSRDHRASAPDCPQCAGTPPPPGHAER